MNLLALWLGTTIVSFCVEASLEMRIFKDVADTGYKINLKKLSEFQKNINPNGEKNVLLQLLIPLYNVMFVFHRTIQYNNAKPMILNQLHTMDVLEEMSKVEKLEYQTKPTGLNALLAPIKAEIRLSNATQFGDKSDNNSNIIYYEGEKPEEITILKATGEFSELTEEEQKKRITDTWKAAAENIKEKYGDLEAWKKDAKQSLKNNGKIEIDTCNNQPSQELNSIEEDELAQNLLNQLDESIDQLDQSHQKAKVYTKRK